MYKRVGPVTLVALSYALVLLSDVVAGLNLPCVMSFIGDGECDNVNNNSNCEFDGGDCCSCTCTDADYSCGGRGFSCIDPSAPCVDDDDVTVSPNCEVDLIGNAICDNCNNIEECDYDGGDCCDCTCVSNEYHTCGVNDFACADPLAPCFDGDMSVSFSYNDCIHVYIEDGYCDSVNNNEECGYDGGDCCECTCGSDLEYPCGLFSPFDCIDPGASCVEDAAVGAIQAGGEDSH